MSEYQVTKMKAAQSTPIENREFDDKEDAEHFAKNASLNDGTHFYAIQKNHQGNFITIKAYQQGQVIEKMS